MSSTSKKKNIAKKVNKSESEDEDSEHELFYYANDRIKLMKEVLKLLKSKKIKSMAPECLKDVDIEDMNSMLLEELLGISKKRLKKIFEGQNNDDESSSESDEDIDIISLDDITDDDDIGIVEITDSGRNIINKRKHKKHRPKRIKTEKGIEVKREKDSELSAGISGPRKVKKVNTERKKSTDGKKPEGENEKLLSVLELLELQARARAIKSQLLIEAENKQKAALEKEKADLEKVQTIGETVKSGNESEDDAIIIDTPKDEEIIIPSSDSEQDENTSKINEKSAPTIQDKPDIIDLDKDDEVAKPKQPKFRIIRNRVIKPSLTLEGLTITVTNEKATPSKETIVKSVNIDKENSKSSKDSIKEESLANVSEFIGPSLGPIEMIHLDTFDVDLNEIILPAKETGPQILSIEHIDVISSEYIEKNSTNKKELENINSSDKIQTEITKSVNDEIRETEEGEISDDKEDSDNDDVLQLDTIIDD